MEMITDLLWKQQQESLARILNDVLWKWNLSRDFLLCPAGRKGKQHSEMRAQSYFAMPDFHSIDVNKCVLPYPGLGCPKSLWKHSFPNVNQSWPQQIQYQNPFVISFHINLVLKMNEWHSWNLYYAYSDCALHIFSLAKWLKIIALPSLIHKFTVYLSTVGKCLKFLMVHLTHIIPQKYYILF